MTQKSLVIKESSLLNISRILSIVSLPLSLLQSVIFLIYVVKLNREEYYYHGITAEVCVHACLIYGLFFKKSSFLLPYILVQLIAGICYVVLAFTFGVQVLEQCDSFFTCPDTPDSELSHKAEFMVLASITIPIQCAVAAVMVKTYKLLCLKRKLPSPVDC